ncbi:MAG: rod shape-determining protein RodA [Bacteriovoracaceae bacterium]|nr:rod shape-determining protein RodA [Bacteriovoracaceae bacterium]
MLSSSKVVDWLKRYDFSFLLAVTTIFIIGLINLYSATHASSSNGLYKTQLLWFFLSMFVAVVISFIRPKTLFRFSYAFYFFNIALLVLVLIMGHKGMGAQRWLVLGPLRFQPSELMKVTVTLALGRWFSKSDPGSEMGLKELIIPFIIAFIPALLIILEPDLGTGLLIILIFLVVAFYRKLKWKTIGILAIIAVLSGTVMYNFGLKEYQRKRIVTFLNPDADARGSGYNAIQSKIAIGSGKFWGKGHMQSTQASLNYLPENHTDFVFSIYNEEHGFFGSVLLIGLYLLLLFRFIWLAGSVNRFYDSVVVIGLMSIFFWHIFVNMGMVTGILPIVGLPLPFMSYGGSSLLTFGICTGLATSFSNSRSFF